MNPTAALLDDPERMRHADRELLSLALMQSRNQTLAWLALFEAAATLREPAWPHPFEPAGWIAGHAGWWQERWIARNVQCGRGVDADPACTPLASIEPEADAWWAETAISQGRWLCSEPPSLEHTRAYLAESLEVTLELLQQAPPDDLGLHAFRAALFVEDGLLRRFVAQAQARGIAVAARLLPERRHSVPREPLAFAAQCWTLGSPRGGYVPENEQWAADADLPGFEIDAQPVSWSQFREFVEDGGYDSPGWWSPAGQRWLEATSRRAPRDVEQVHHGVQVRRFGRLQRAPAGEPAMQLSWYEADAWCRWAGRRLPTEPEWELAASRGVVRGFAWGDVAEWVAGHARAWPDGADVPDTSLRVQRGLAWFEPRRLGHAKARRFVAAERDEGFAGFRSCASG